MKHPLIAMSLIGLLGTTPVVCWSPAHAANSNVEAALQNYGDLSMFYQALLNTGVINELNENQRYTIFAPTNAAFASQIRRETYPCFYAEQCRPQIAAILRNHIVLGRYDLRDLVTYGAGVQTSSGRFVHVDEPYVAEYSVDGQRILSKGEVGGSVVYRINGVLVSPRDLSQFQTVRYVPVPGGVTTEKTVIRKTYHTPVVPEAYPAGGMVPESVIVPDGGETTTVIHSYTTE